MSFAEDFSKLAADLVERFGGSTSLRRITRVYNVETQTTEESSVVYTFKATVGARKEFNRDGTFTLQTEATIPATSIPVTPRVDDIFVMNGVNHRILAVATVAPDGTPIIYKLTLGRWLQSGNQ